MAVLPLGREYIVVFILLFSLAYVTPFTVAKAAQISAAFAGEPFPTEKIARGDDPFWGLHPDIECNLYLNGQIENGDADRLIQLYQREYVARLATRSGMKADTPVLPVREQFYVTLCFDSSGGSWDEGLALGKAISLRSITTVVKANSECYSACALAFMFGTWNPMIGPNTLGHPSPSRYLHHLGSLGFHSPKLDRTAYLPGASEKEWQVLSNMNYALAISDFRQLTEASIKYKYHTIPVFEDDLLLTIASTAPSADGFDSERVCATDHMACVGTVGNALDWRIDVFGPEAIPDLNSDTALLICNGSAGRRKAYSEYGMMQLYQRVEALTGKRANRILSNRFSGAIFEPLFSPDERVFGQLGGAQGSSPCLVSKRIHFLGNEVQEVSPLYFFPRDLPLAQMAGAVFTPK